MYRLSGRATSRRIARTSTERALLFFLLLSAGCATGAPAPAMPDATVAVPAMLRASAKDWNRGDLDGFLDDYLDSPETAFVGSDVSFGVDEIRARYLRSYWSTGRPEGLLAFEDIHVRPIGSDHALARGRYVLTDRSTDRLTSTGMFSLVLVRTPDGWRIIHDHSSESPLPN